MDEMKGQLIVKRLLRKWRWISIMGDLMLASGISFLLVSIFHIVASCSHYWMAPVFVVAFAGLLFLHRAWKVNEHVVARLLDQTYPVLEESTGLLLRNFSSLSLLEKWQHKKTTEALLSISSPLTLSKKLLIPALIATACIVAGIALLFLPTHAQPDTDVARRSFGHAAVPEKLLPELADVHVSIEPPAYTRKGQRQQQALNIVAEEGSLVNWQLRTNSPAKQVVFIFNYTLQLALHPNGRSATNWQMAKRIDSASFYQLSIDGKLSDFYKIEAIRDAAPVIRVVSPHQYTTIDFGEAQQLRLSTEINDDYSISAAGITATIASGNGEAVKFKEQQISLAGFSPGKKEYHLQQWLSLASMSMRPGDELYFYIHATDNHQQQSRSDVYIVHLPDTAQLMSLEGLGNALTVKPEYFRSERQIIIETEQLLKEKDTMSAEAFKNRSNNLGIDQKLLRLRYSKFLGDETETGETNIDEVGGINDFSNAEKLKDAFTDKHDNAEDATFFEPGTKKQLQATLAEMWKAEMHLRTFTPQAALPFEYKALRLLKDLQQQSRAYVAKTGFKSTALDPGKRLSGDLSKISAPLIQKNINADKDPQLATREALSVLEAMSSGGIVNNSFSLLSAANLQLHKKAVQQPGKYLPAIEALKRIIDHTTTGKPVAANDFLIAEYGLQQLLQVPLPVPAAASAQSAQTLSKQYFEILQKRQP